ncbi:MAG: dipicolinate synthase subunit DpsA [Clostridia bacterium]
MTASFGIIGGDKRQLYLAKSIKKDGFNVYICGFELSCDTAGLEEVSLNGIFEKCENIILPLPCTRDYKTIFSPYSDNEFVVDDNFISLLLNKNIYGGYMELLTKNNELWKNINLEDYYKKEELAIYNAIPTAEGAIALAIENHDGILNSSNCLVTGFGRIGKALTKILIGMGANVDVASRKNEDFAMTKLVGARAIKYKNIEKKYDIIFNTVPVEVVGKDILNFQNNETIIIELASLPGGIDRKTALLKGIKIIDAQSLPGKVAPMASAEFIKETIFNIKGDD